MVDPNPLAHLWAWTEIHVGAQNEGGAYYGFWSGFGSDLGEITLIAAIAAWYKTKKCETCWRRGRHTTEDTAQKLCHHHWTREHIDAAKARHRLKFPRHLAHEAKP